MEVMGNIFTHYNYTTTDITQTRNEDIITFASVKSGFKVELGTERERVLLPHGSPFKEWKEARRFAGPLPFTFTYDAATKTVLIIEGVRENWTPAPLKVLDYKFSFLDSLHIDGMKLANAFVISDIPYYWKKGKKEQWKA